MRKIAFRNIVLLLAGVVVGLGLLEAGLRIAGYIVLRLRDTASPDSPSVARPFTILCVGESTTYCGNHSYAYPPQLEKVLRERYPGRSFRVINRGKPGCNTGYIARKLPEWLEDYQPDMVSAMMGINDSRERLAPYESAGRDEGFWESLRGVKVLRFAWKNLAHILRSGTRILIWDADDYVAEGRRLFGVGEDEESERLFLRAIDLDPKNAAAHVGLARYYMNSQNTKKVISECKSALALDPQNDAALTVRGRAGMESRKWREGAGYLEQAVGINPLNDEALGALSWCYYWEQERFKEAEDLALRALKIDPANYMANATAWYIYKGKREPERALDIALKALEADPHNDRFIAEISHLFDLLGDPEQSKEYLDKIETARGNAINPITVQSYKTLRELCGRRGITLLAVQYPMRSIKPLQKIAGEGEGVIFVDNETVFREMVNRDSYQAYFEDHFAGDFGHCTPAGNALLAENIARHIDPKLIVDSSRPR